MRDSRGLRDWESWIDQVIREAQERGDFENLPGAGQPLDLKSNPYAQDRQLAFKVLKDAGYAPDWIELDKAIRRKLEKAREVLGRSWTWREARLTELAEKPDKWAEAERQRVLATWKAAIASFEEDVRAINGEIADLNLKVPSPRFQRAMVHSSREIALLEGDWREQRG